MFIGIDETGCDGCSSTAIIFVVDSTLSIPRVRFHLNIVLSVADSIGESAERRRR
jgi:hypothetical protein